MQLWTLSSVNSANSSREPHPGCSTRRLGQKTIASTGNPNLSRTHRRSCTYRRGNAVDLGSAAFSGAPVGQFRQTRVHDTEALEKRAHPRKTSASTGIPDLSVARQADGPSTQAAPGRSWARRVGHHERLRGLESPPKCGGVKLRRIFIRLTLVLRYR